MSTFLRPLVTFVSFGLFVAPMAYAQHTGTPVVGAFLNAVEFSKLPSSERKCDKHRVVYAECGHLHATMEMVSVTRTPEVLDAWRQNAIMLAKRYRRMKRAFPALDYVEFVPQEGTFNNACRFCAFGDWCRSGRPLGFVEANFAIEPWEPYERAAVEREHTAHLP